MRIENVKIYTMEANMPVVECGYVEIQDGKIIQVGACEGDGSGGWLLPGLIDGHTHLGIVEDSLNFEGDDVNEAVDPVTPHLRGMDAINPLDRCFEEARECGITCVVSGPGSANPIGGQLCAIKTSGKRIDKMLLCETAAMKFAMGENPKSVYHGKNQSPETRMATAALIREYLTKAGKYAEAKQKALESKMKAKSVEEGDADHDEEDEIEEPDFDMKLESLLGVVTGKIPAHFHAHRADDIFTAIRIAKEFSLKYSIIHCTEGYLIADELAQEGVTAFVGPNICDRSKPELKNLSFTNPGILSKNGVKIGLTTDHPVIPMQYLMLCAALAVKNGMELYEALKAVTINPAEILGLDHRIGSIKAGKDADLVLFDGNPLEVMTNVKEVYINGIRVKG